MNILVINCGSSSLKFQVIDSETENVLAKGICDRIGIDGSVIKYTPAGGETEETETAMPTHTEAVKLVIDALTNEKTGVLKSLDDVDAIGHRIVQGGEIFKQSTLLDDEAIKNVADLSDLAPLHNPAHVIGINACKELMPNVPQVGVFDTVFHGTMPKKAYMYGIPYRYYKDYKVRRYGAHGTSHSYVSERAAKLEGKPYDNLKTIVCHLGNGASICAVENGKSVDTSMGLSPLEGLIMGTRSGDIDPSAIELIAKKEGFDISEAVTMLNKKSGMLGLTEISSDFRDICAAVEDGNEQAAMALDTYCYRVAKYVGAYCAAMNGVDVIAFTAGIGENTDIIRKKVCEYFGYIGLKLDDSKNDNCHEERKISADDSKVAVYVIPTNEELKIAQETAALVQK